MRKITIAGFVAAAALIAACGGNGSSVKESDGGNTAAAGNAAAESPAPKPKAAKIGATLTVKASGTEAAWTLTTVETKDTDRYGSKPDNGGRWVLTHVKVAVTGDRETYICSCDLSIIGKSGKVYRQSMALFQGRPDLTGASVAPGQNTDGWVIFAVAKPDLRGARLQLQQQAILDDTAFGYWSLDR